MGAGNILSEQVLRAMTKECIFEIHIELQRFDKLSRNASAGAGKCNFIMG